MPGSRLNLVLAATASVNGLVMSLEVGRGLENLAADFTLGCKGAACVLSNDVRLELIDRGEVLPTEFAF
jgi:hypothetical protein